MSDKKHIKFIGGPLDGKTREIDNHLTTYELDEPPPPEDIEAGDIPIGFFPPYHKYIYEASPTESDTFIYRKH
jgi:hypothetical protein